MYLSFVRVFKFSNHVFAFFTWLKFNIEFQIFLSLLTINMKSSILVDCESHRLVTSNEIDTFCRTFLSVSSLCIDKHGPF
jgi:hypothetical protein